MGRAFGLIALLVPLAVGAWLLATQLQSNGPTSPAVTHSETLGQANVAATNLQSAATAMQAWFIQNSTYAGATLPPGTGAVLVRADQTSYCIQTATAPAYHEDGPAGQAQPGPCV
jgi:hypothetical protein